MIDKKAAFGIVILVLAGVFYAATHHHINNDSEMFIPIIKDHYFTIHHREWQQQMRADSILYHRTY